MKIRLGLLSLSIFLVTACPPNNQSLPTASTVDELKANVKAPTDLIGANEALKTVNLNEALGFNDDESISASSIQELQGKTRIQGSAIKPELQWSDYIYVFSKPGQRFNLNFKSQDENKIYGFIWLYKNGKWEQSGWAYDKNNPKYFNNSFTLPEGTTIALVGFFSQTGGVVSASLSSAPKLEALSHEQGPIGSTVVLNGEGFHSEAQKNTVKFGDVSATIINGDSNQLTVHVPEGITGQLPVSVSHGELSTNAQNFKVLPQIESISSSFGAAKTSISITGKGFGTDLGSNQVYFGSTAARVIQVSSNALTVEVPEGGTSGALSVETPGGKGVGPNFTYDKGQIPGTPEVFSLEPNTGKVGETITIKGNHFSTQSAQNRLTFNGLPAQILSASDTELKVQVPTGATLNSQVVASKSIAVTDEYIDRIPLSSGVEGDFRPSQSQSMQGTHHFNSIHIPKGVTIKAEGNGPLVLQANGDVVIDGVIDASGQPGKDFVNPLNNNRMISHIIPRCGERWVSDHQGYLSYNDPRLRSPVVPGGSGGGQGGQSSYGLGNWNGAGEGGGQPATATEPPGAGQLKIKDSFEPFIGGSGGGPGNNFNGIARVIRSAAFDPHGCAYFSWHIGPSGGGGGGAIKIVTRGKIIINGEVKANGGNGGGRGTEREIIDSQYPRQSYWKNLGLKRFYPSAGGSGGALWLIGKEIQLTGKLSALGGKGVAGEVAHVSSPDGGIGKIRLETNKLENTGESVPQPEQAGNFTSFVKRNVSSDIQAVSSPIGFAATPRSLQVLNSFGEFYLSGLSVNTQTSEPELSSETLDLPLDCLNTTRELPTDFDQKQKPCFPIDYANGRVLLTSSSIEEDIGAYIANAYFYADLKDKTVKKIKFEEKSVYNPLTKSSAIKEVVPNDDVKLSPDGKFISFQQYAQRLDGDKEQQKQIMFEIHTMNLDTGKIHRVTSIERSPNDFQGVSFDEHMWLPNSTLAFIVKYPPSRFGDPLNEDIQVNISPTSLNKYYFRQGPNSYRNVVKNLRDQLYLNHKDELIFRYRSIGHGARNFNLQTWMDNCYSGNCENRTPYTYKDSATGKELTNSVYAAYSAAVNLTNSVYAYSKDKRYLAYFDNENLILNNLSTLSKKSLNLGRPTSSRLGFYRHPIQWDPDGTGVLVSTQKGLYFLSPDGEKQHLLNSGDQHHMMGWYQP